MVTNTDQEAISQIRRKLLTIIDLASDIQAASISYMSDVSGSSVYDKMDETIHCVAEALYYTGVFMCENEKQHQEEKEKAVQDLCSYVKSTCADAHPN